MRGADCDEVAVVCSVGGENNRLDTSKHNRHRLMADTENARVDKKYMVKIT